MRKKDMKKTNENITISYKGNVTVEAINAKTGKKTRRVQKHNQGFNVFFELIALSIAGNDMSASMPRYLRGLDVSKNKLTVASFIAYNSPVIIKEETSATVKFEFLIPFTQLSETETTRFLRLYNRTTSTESPFAEVDLGENAFTGDGQTNYLVVWTIKIGNAPA